MSPQEVAQTMLDRYGYFVICYAAPVKIGLVQNRPIYGYPTGKDFVAQIVIVGEASPEDFAKQCELGHVDPNQTPPSYKYRAVAE